VTGRDRAGEPLPAGLGHVVSAPPFAPLAACVARLERAGVEVALGGVYVDEQHSIPVEPGDAARFFEVGAPVWAGIRPERLKLDVGRGEGLPIGKGVVRTLVSDGVAATVGVAWAGLELRTHLLAGRGLARTLRPGDAVTLSVRPEDVHLLPRG